MLRDDTLAKRQPKSASSERGVGIQPVEQLEHPVALLRRDADTVVAGGGDDAGNMGAMSGFVVWVGVGFDEVTVSRETGCVGEVPPGDIVDVAVAVVVDVHETGNLSRVAPDLLNQVEMLVVDA